jgi:hypothetical protein
LDEAQSFCRKLRPFHSALLLSIGERLAAAIGHVRDAEVAGRLDRLGHDAAVLSDARHSPVELARVGLGVGEELLDRLDRHLGGIEKSSVPSVIIDTGTRSLSGSWGVFLRSDRITSDSDGVRPNE